METTLVLYLTTAAIAQALAVKALEGDTEMGAAYAASVDILPVQAVYAGWQTDKLEGRDTLMLFTTVYDAADMIYDLIAELDSSDRPIFLSLFHHQCRPDYTDWIHEQLHMPE